jgi:hypothetical protein
MGACRPGVSPHCSASVHAPSSMAPASPNGASRQHITIDDLEVRVELVELDQRPLALVPFLNFREGHNCV